LNLDSRIEWRKRAKIKGLVRKRYGKTYVKGYYCMIKKPCWLNICLPINFPVKLLGAPK
jgi:hypothetical protein